ncbi:HlyD family efflux transporter periplasmic adaptor subunit [Lysobacter enzymogenes]|uniref:HlyD family efflux transporter periplasmic adaptor subunit n=1 Tax=Lysobacter enzymogenes TaxID=69 RepID=UPI0008974B8B|nr:HlyD family secretion protein [Lysobacter enzymogenes]SDX98395.1 HlyD family secretion protein [Lysobacter enzymogenes]
MIRLLNRPAPLLLCLALASALSGCGRDEPARDAAPPATTSASTFAAVARGRVDVEGGLLKLGMAAEGVLARVPVREGERVAAGQELAALDATAARADDRIAEARLAQARAQVNLLQQRLAQARVRAQRLGAAAAAGAGDGQSADDARDALAQLQDEADSARAAADIAAAQRDQAAAAMQRQTLHAPVAGELARVAARVGMSVAPHGAPLFVLLPDGERIVRAELNAAFLDNVHPGMRAQILDDGDTQRVLGAARVLRLSPAFGPSTLEDDPDVRANERTVECVLALDKAGGLRIGQRVLVRFLSAAAGTQRTP